MAIEVERMLVTLEARIDQYEKNLAKAAGTTDAQLGAIESRGRKMEAVFNATTARGTKGFDALGKVVKTTEVQTGNLAAQFQDIGVQLAGGQSPFLIALQQGGQISQAFGSAGVRGALMGVGGALASLVSPMSLITIGLIAATGYAIQYFTSVEDTGKKAELSLAEQESLIQRVAQKWAEAVPGLKAYADELQRVKDAGDLQTAGGIKIAEDQASINKALDDFISKNQEVVDAINMAYDATGRSDASLSQFAASWAALEARIRDGTATQDDFTEATKLLRGAVADSGGDLDAFGTQFETLAGRILSSLTALQQFQAQMRTALNAGIAAQAQIQNLTTGQINNPNLPDPNFPLPKTGPTPDSRPPIELEGLPSVSGGSRSAAASDAERQQKAVTDLIAKLEYERSLVGKSEIEQAKMNALREAGAAATDEQKAKILDLVESTAQEKAALESVTKALNEVNDAAKDAAGSIIRGLRDGASAAEIMNDVFIKISDRLIDMSLNQIFPTTGGGFLSSLFGGLFGSTSSSTYFPPAPKAPAVSASTSSAWMAKAANDTGAVSAKRSSGETVVNLINNSQATVRQEETTAAGGGRQTNFVIEDSVAGAMRPGSSANRAMRTNFGMSQRLTKR